MLSVSQQHMPQNVEREKQKQPSNEKPPKKIKHCHEKIKNKTRKHQTNKQNEQLNKEKCTHEQYLPSHPKANISKVSITNIKRQKRKKKQKSKKTQKKT